MHWTIRCQAVKAHWQEENTGVSFDLSYVDMGSALLKIDLRITTPTPIHA